MPEPEFASLSCRYPLRRQDRCMSDEIFIRHTLETARVGSFSFVDGDEPYVIPWSYGYDLNDGKLRLYLHCAHSAGRKLAILAKNPKVAFEIHCDLVLNIDEKHPCSSGWSFRSVTGVGHMRQLQGPEKVHGLQRLFENQAKRIAEGINEKVAEMVDVLCLDVDTFTGKQLNIAKAPLPIIG